MRKADYAALASVISHRMTHHTHEIAKAVSTMNEARMRDAHLARSELEIVARAFASHASIDRIAFLKACDIDP